MTGPVRLHGGALLSRKLPAFLIALSLLVALPGVAMAQTNTARLIDVHAITISKAKPGSGTANCSNDLNQSSGAFVTTGWVVQGNKTARLNASTVPANLGNITSQLQASFTAWGSKAGVPDITVTTGATITRQTANHSYDLLWGRTGGSSIAVTYTWQWSNGEIESDTVFNKGLPWSVISASDGCNEQVAAYDVANIATHEFGHTYGLTHPSGARWDTMYAFGFTGETLKRTLATGDSNGIDALY
jgi:hypothetical protein